MNSRTQMAARCRRCRLHERLCICALTSPIAARTRVVMLVHASEDRKSTNTGRIAALCLSNSQVVVHGGRSHPTAPLDADDQTEMLFLFPHPGAAPLARFAAGGRPITLVVPDGTWRQASKMRHRVPGLWQVPCVSLPDGAPSQYRLRAPQHAGGLATMEAVARAMGILEGPEVERALDLVFRVMVERTLWSRGKLSAADVTGGVPAVLQTAHA